MIKTSTRVWVILVIILVLPLPQLKSQVLCDSTADFEFKGIRLSELLLLKELDYKDDGINKNSIDSNFQLRGFRKEADSCCTSFIDNEKGLDIIFNRNKKEIGKYQSLHNITINSILLFIRIFKDKNETLAEQFIREQRCNEMLFCEEYDQGKEILFRDLNQSPRILVTMTECEANIILL